MEITRKNKLNPSAPEFFPDSSLHIHASSSSTIHQQVIINQPLIPFTNFLINYHQIHHYLPHHDPINLPAGTSSIFISSIPSVPPPPPENPNFTFSAVSDQKTLSDPPQKTPLPTRTDRQRGINGGFRSSSRGSLWRRHQDQCYPRKECWRVRGGNNNGGDRGRQCSRGGKSSRHRLVGSRGKDKHVIDQVESNCQKTSVMIRNIPNRYTRELLMEFLDNHCMEENQKAKLKGETSVSAYDFLYLPVDFGRRANKGYAFVNFTDARAVWRFKQATNNQNWDLFHSHKIREISYARLQGKDELVKHFENSKFECETEDYLPVCFSPPRDGASKPLMANNQRIVGKRVGGIISGDHI